LGTFSSGEHTYRVVVGCEGYCGINNSDWIITVPEQGNNIFSVSDQELFSTELILNRPTVRFPFENQDGFWNTWAATLTCPNNPNRELGCVDEGFEVRFDGSLLTTGGEPVPNVQIYIIDLEGDALIATNITDSEGNFIIYWTHMLLNNSYLKNL